MTNDNSSKTSQSEPCSSNKECTSHVAELVQQDSLTGTPYRVQPVEWEEEFGRSVPISYSNIIVSEDNPYVSVAEVKKFIRTLLDKERKQITDFYEVAIANAVENARREERERIADICDKTAKKWRDASKIKDAYKPVWYEGNANALERLSHYLYSGEILSHVMQYVLSESELEDTNSKTRE
jgi:hypothetical protein